MFKSLLVLPLLASAALGSACTGLSRYLQGNSWCLSCGDDSASVTLDAPIGSKPAACVCEDWATGDVKGDCTITKNGEAGSFADYIKEFSATYGKRTFPSEEDCENGTFDDPDDRFFCD